MEKVYVLLRHNEQTGPYTLQQLVQFNLQPGDLIRIEGNPGIWYYPHEIPALHPYLSFLAAASGRPRQDVAVQKETRVETPPASQVPVTAPPASLPADIPVIPDKHLPGTLPNLEEAVYAQFRMPETEKRDAGFTAYPAVSGKRTLRHYTVAGVVIVLGISSVLTAFWMLNREEVKEPMAATFPFQAPIQTEVAPPVAGGPDKASSRQQVRQTSQSLTASRSNAPVPAPAVVKQQAVQKNKMKGSVAATEVSEPEEINAPTESLHHDADAGEEHKTSQEKKKTLKDKIADLFRKKSQESRPAESTPGERVATRREESSSLAPMVHVRFDIPNNWMMGIKGAKATLVNRNSETVVKAVAEVRYYNDDNDLLDKKTIVFTNIKGKGTRTVAVPDHATATTLAYSIVSAVGNEPVARR